MSIWISVINKKFRLKKSFAYVMLCFRRVLSWKDPFLSKCHLQHSIHNTGSHVREDSAEMDICRDLFESAAIYSLLISNWISCRPKWIFFILHRFIKYENSLPFTRFHIYPSCQVRNCFSLVDSPATIRGRTYICHAPSVHLRPQCCISRENWYRDVREVETGVFREVRTLHILCVRFLLSDNKLR
jgi:hypothetical protein